MIIENGKISALVKTGGGGLNQDGDPVAPSSHWADAIPCNIKANKYSNKGVTNGNTFVSASYEVLIETAEPFTAEQVRLEMDGGKVLGEFSVLQIEPLMAVGSIRIVV